MMCIKPGVTKTFAPSIFGLVKFGGKFGFGALRRIRQLECVFNAHHLAPAHYFLLAVGTTKQHSGTDIRKFLIQRAREAGVPIYAEISNRGANLGFYRKRGLGVLILEHAEETGPAFVLISRHGAPSLGNTLRYGP